MQKCEACRAQLVSEDMNMLEEISVGEETVSSEGKEPPESKQHLPVGLNSTAASEMKEKDEGKDDRDQCYDLHSGDQAKLIFNDDSAVAKKRINEQEKHDSVSANIRGIYQGHKEESSNDFINKYSRPVFKYFGKSPAHFHANHTLLYFATMKNLEDKDRTIAQKPLRALQGTFLVDTKPAKEKGLRVSLASKKIRK